MRPCPAPCRAVPRPRLRVRPAHFTSRPLPGGGVPGCAAAPLPPLPVPVLSGREFAARFASNRSLRFEPPRPVRRASCDTNLSRQRGATASEAAPPHTAPGGGLLLFRGCDPPTRRSATPRPPAGAGEVRWDERGHPVLSHQSECESRSRWCINSGAAFPALKRTKSYRKGLPLARVTRPRHAFRGRETRFQECDKAMTEG